MHLSMEGGDVWFSKVGRGAFMLCGNKSVLQLEREETLFVKDLHKDVRGTINCCR